MAKEVKTKIVEDQRVSRIQEMIDILNRDSVVTPEAISFEMGMPKTGIYKMAGYINRRHLEDPENYPHIYNTGMGYSTTQKKEYSIYETGSRMKHAYGTLANGMPAFAHCKLVAPRQFAAIKAVYNPTAVGMNKLLTAKIKKNK